MSKLIVNSADSRTVFQHELEELINNHQQDANLGKVATYIPELAKSNPKHLGVSIRLLSGETLEAGDVRVPFTMQSISKVLTLALALMDHGEEYVFKRVGMEPTGDPFNSIVKLETIHPNKPLNPMINAGAIAVSSMIRGNKVEEKLERVLTFIRKLCKNSEISYNERVAESESKTSDLNRALAYFMREHEVFEGDIEEILEFYFKHCAIEVHCLDLANIGAVLANNGQDVETGETLIPPKIARICKTFMVTCGMYNASGEFAIQAGFPAKSGVSGGILGTVPTKMGIGVLGPSLDDKGNSVAGVKLLESMSDRWNLSIF